MNFASINRVLKPHRVLVELNYIVLFLIPVGLHLYLNWAIIQQGIFPEGDWATLSIMTRRAVSFDQFLGNYSRFGWSHPGPFMFYIIGPLSLLFKRFASPEMLAVFCYQVIFFYMAYRLLISLNGLFAGLMLVVMVWLIYVGMVRIYPAELFRTLFFNYWAPLLTLFPMLFLLLTSAAAASGRHAALLPLAFSAAIMPQLHIGTSFHAAFFFGIGLSFLIAKDLKNNGRYFYQRHRRLVLASAVVVVVIWFLPFYETAINGGGNLLKVFKFFFFKEAGMASGPSFGQAMQYLLAFYAVPMQTLLLTTGIASHPSPQLLSAVVMILCSALCIIAFKQANIQQRLLIVFPWVFFLVSIPSVLKIRGEMYPYLMYWQFANVALLYAVVFSALCRTIAELAFKAAKIRIINYYGNLAAVVFLIGTCGLLSRVAPISFGPDLPKQEFFSILSGWIAKTGEEVKLSSGDHATWPYVAGVINASLAANLPVCVPDEWLWVYGKLSRCRDRTAKREIIFFDHLDNTKLKKYLDERDGITIKIENPVYGARYLLATGFGPSLTKSSVTENSQTRVSVLRDIR